MNRTRIKWCKNPDGTPGYTWNPIPSWPSYYASQTGLIASTKRGPLKILRPITAKDGHQYVFLYSNVNGDMTKQWVHRLVLQTFRGRPKPGQESRHRNGVPGDNRLDNLAWGTRQDNADDRVRHGRSPRGERSGTHKLTEADVRDIRRRRTSVSSRQLGREYGVSHTTILAACSGEHWRNVY